MPVAGFPLVTRRLGEASFSPVSFIAFTCRLGIQFATIDLKNHTLRRLCLIRMLAARHWTESLADRGLTAFPRERTAARQIADAR